MEFSQGLVPSDWNGPDANKIFLMIKLEKEDDEYKRIENYFNSIKMFRILEINRIETKYAYTSAMIAKEKNIYLKHYNVDVSGIFIRCVYILKKNLLILGRFVN